jgi:hypothetical protein
MHFKLSRIKHPSDHKITAIIIQLQERITEYCEGADKEKQREAGIKKRNRSRVLFGI